MLRAFISFHLTLLALFAAAAASAAEPIRLGTTTALTGPAKVLGQAMVRGMQSHFQEINAAGGVHGRQIELLALDDGYHPDSARRQMQRLIEDYQVLAVAGNVGTPTAKVTAPMAEVHRVPLIGAFTGANLLRKRPPDRYVVNYRASYEEETAAMIDALLEQGVHAEEIAFFTQNDAYGDAGYQGALKALSRHGHEDGGKLLHGRYNRNTLHVQDALVTLLTAPTPPRAVIIVATYGPAARFIRQAVKALPDTLFINISFVGADALARELDGCCTNVYVSQVVPPLTSELPAVVAYRQALARSHPGVAPDYTSFEGYLVARLLVMALKEAAPGAGREQLIDTFERLSDLDIGIGARLEFSRRDHQGSHQVWLTRIAENQVVAARWNELVRGPAESNAAVGDPPTGQTAAAEIRSTGLTAHETVK